MSKKSISVYVASVNINGDEMVVLGVFDDYYVARNTLTTWLTERWGSHWANIGDRFVFTTRAISTRNLDAGVIEQQYLNEMVAGALAYANAAPRWQGAQS